MLLLVLIGYSGLEDLTGLTRVLALSKLYGLIVLLLVTLFDRVILGYNLDGGNIFIIFIATGVKKRAVKSFVMFPSE